MVLVPLIAFVANVFERRGRFSLLMQQEYASLASTFLLRVSARQSDRDTNRDFLSLQRNPGILCCPVFSVSAAS